MAVFGVMDWARFDVGIGRAPRTGWVTPAWQPLGIAVADGEPSPVHVSCGAFCFASRFKYDAESWCLVFTSFMSVT